MNKFSIAELRGFQQASMSDGAMVTIASDQRNGMRALLADEPGDRTSITDSQLGNVKSDIVKYLAAHASSVLLDPVCAVPNVIRDGVLPRDVALLIGLDASGYDVDPAGYRMSRLAKDIGARRVRELGGTGGKIMVYLRADRPEANDHNIALLRKCVEDFAREDLFLVVEFLTYKLDNESDEDFAEAYPELVVGGARIAVEAGAKLMKIPYPGSAAACAAVDEIAVDVPWAVLSAGVDHASFIEQVRTAAAHGAIGVIAGRALWKDCISLDRNETRRRLLDLAVPRLNEIYSVVREGRSLRANAASSG